MKILQLLAEYHGNRKAGQDEALGAPDAAIEESFYRQLAATQTTPVSVGHRSTIVK